MSSSTEISIVIFLLAIFFGAIVIWFQHTVTLIGKYLQYSVLIFIFGLILASIANLSDPHGSFSTAFNSAKSISPQIIMFVFLPPLLFESASTVNYHIFRRLLSSAVILAIPAVLLGSFLTAIIVRYIFPYNWSWQIALLVGSILSATDPVSVVSTLSEMNTKKTLSVIIEGESLLNDGSAFVLFSILLELISGNELNGGNIILSFIRLSLGGIAWGLLFGVLLCVWLVNIDNHPILEISIISVACYTTFFLAELIHVSGVLAVVTLGLIMSWRGSFFVSPQVASSYEFYIIQISHYSETAIFFIAGIVVYDGISVASNGYNWGYLILLFIFLHIIRFIILLVCFPLLNKIGYKLSFKEILFMSFVGLRGAVGLSLVLILRQESGLLANNDVQLILFHTAGIVFFSTLINGTFSKYIYLLFKFDGGHPYRTLLYKKAIHSLETIFIPNQLNLIKSNWYFSHYCWKCVLKLVPDLRYTQIHNDQIKIDESIPSVYSILSSHQSQSNDQVNLVKSNITDEKSDEQYIELSSDMGKCVYFDDKVGQDNIYEYDCENFLKNPMNQSFFCKPDYLQHSPSLKLSKSMSLVHLNIPLQNHLDDLSQTIFTVIHNHYHHQFDKGLIESHAIAICQEAIEISRDDWMAKLYDSNLELSTTINEALVLEWKSLLSLLPIKIEYTKRFFKTPMLKYFVTFYLLDSIYTSIQAVNAYIRAHSQIIDEFSNEVPVFEFEESIRTKTQEAIDWLRSLEKEYPNQYMIASILLLSRSLIRVKCDRIKCLFQDGILTKTNLNSLSDFLSSRMLSLSSYSSLIDFFRISQLNNHPVEDLSAIEAFKQHIFASDKKE